MKHEPKHTPGPYLLDMLNAAVLHLERINYLASRPDINGYPNSEFVTPESEMAKFHAAIKKADGIGWGGPADKYPDLSAKIRAIIAARKLARPGEGGNP